MHDLQGTKKHIEELKTYRRQEKIKDIIDQQTESTLLHTAAKDNQVEILQELIDTGVFNVSQKDVVGEQLL